MVLISDWLVTGLRKKPDLNGEPKNLNINNPLSEKSELVSKVVNIELSCQFAIHSTVK